MARIAVSEPDDLLGGVDAETRGMQAPIVGRERECEAIDGFLDDLRRGPVSLVLEGEPGIGKTTIWEGALRRATERCLRTCAARPVQAERGMSFAAMGDLLADLPEEAFAALPAPQRSALEVALLRAEPAGPPPDQRTIAFACLSLLRQLAGEEPIVVAVDNAQWLDASTATVLQFVARRLDCERVGFVSAVRVDQDPVHTFNDAVPEHRRRVMRVGPLGVVALHQIIEQRFDHAFVRPLLLRIERVSGGNPLHALEIARELVHTGFDQAGPVVLPQGLGRLLSGRVARLPPRARQAVLVAAALADPHTAVVPDAITRAEQEGIVRIDADGKISFTHPLFASAAYESATPQQLRALHRRLSQTADDVEERSRHLALAAEGRSDRVADLLEAGAERARSRGAWESAAELLEQAAARTPVRRAAESLRRTALAAEHHIHAGHRPRAQALLEEILARGLSREMRAKTLGLLAQLQISGDSFSEARVLLWEALECTDDPSFAAALELQLAYVRANTGELDEAAALADRARRRAEQADDRGLLAEALACCAMTGFMAGRGADWRKVERSLALENRERVVPLMLTPSAIAAFLLLYVGRISEARERILAVRRTALADGDESDLAYVLWWLVWLETLSGRYDVAATLAEQAAVAASIAGSVRAPIWVLAQRALLQAHRGEVAAAREECERAAEMTRDIAWSGWTPWLLAARCLIELSVDEHDAAWAAAERQIELVEREGVGEPLRCLFMPDALEALIALGELDRAERLLDAFERAAHELDRGIARAGAGRCRGLLLAARGELDAAAERLARELPHTERLQMPFELARSLLVLGRVQRRRKQWRKARAALERSRAIFAEIGASLWLQKAIAELERTHVKQAPADLSPSERQVALLAAEGCTNRVVAERLFISPKTVEANLARVYRKLGIRTRAELGAAIARAEAPAP